MRSLFRLHGRDRSRQRQHPAGRATITASRTRARRFSSTARRSACGPIRARTRSDGGATAVRNPGRVHRGQVIDPRRGNPVRLPRRSTGTSSTTGSTRASRASSAPTSSTSAMPPRSSTTATRVADVRGLADVPLSGCAPRPVARVLGRSGPGGNRFTRRRLLGTTAALNSPVRALPLGDDDGDFYLYFPMPFATSARNSAHRAGRRGAAGQLRRDAPPISTTTSRASATSTRSIVRSITRRRARTMPCSTPKAVVTTLA